MLLLRPEGDVNELVESLSADMLLDINDRLKPFKTNLKVPKLSYGFRDEMSGYLKSWGWLMPLAVRPTSAGWWKTLKPG